MANEVVDALNQFSQNLQGLAISRATQTAAENVKQINMNEQDVFKRQQQLSQLGNQLALQLTGMGADPTRIQQSVAAVAPPKMNSPQDFFAASQMATDPNAAKQYAQAGAGMQAQAASQPMTTAQLAQNKLQWASLIGSQNDAKAAASDKLQAEMIKKQIPDFDIMPGIMPQEEDVKKIKSASAARLGIQSSVSKLESLVSKYGTETFPSAPGDAMKQITKSTQLQLKEFENLGVLNGKDMEVLTAMLPDPSGTFSSLSTSSPTVLKQYKQFKTELDDRLAGNALARGYTPKKSSPLYKSANKIIQSQQNATILGDINNKLSSVDPNSPNYEILMKTKKAIEDQNSELFKIEGL